MTNNTAREQLQKASNTLREAGANVALLIGRLPASDDEASEQHSINTQSIADAAATANASIDLVAWTD